MAALRLSLLALLLAQATAQVEGSQQGDGGAQPPLRSTTVSSVIPSF